jgi:hypothetical protein
MAFHGDLFSFPLPELLQWLDSSRKTGCLRLSWEGGERKLFLKDGSVVATSALGLWERAARLLELGKVSTANEVMATFQEIRRGAHAVATFVQHNLEPQVVSTFAREELYGAVVDLTQADDGEFHWGEDDDPTGNEWLPLELSLRALVFEALRWLDEAAEIERALPADAVRIRAKVPPSDQQPLVTRIILTLCQPVQSLGQVRLTMGLSRTAGARRVFDLVRSGLVEVEGIGELADDPLGQMLENGLELVRQKQFDAAALVFTGLLQMDPADRRVREFARMVEAEHIAALYGELPPLSVLVPVNDLQGLSRLRPDERRLAEMVNGVWDVSTLTLASHMKELDTLKTLKWLMRQALVRRKDSAA